MGTGIDGKMGIFFYIKADFYLFLVFLVLYSTLLYLPPLRFYCIGGCWDRTEDSWDYGTDQTL